MTCDELKDLYELYTLDVLEAVEREEIDAHLARGCEACRQGVRQALSMNAAMLNTASDAEPPARLKRRVMAAIGAGTERRSPWGWVAALAAAAMLLFAVRTSIEKRQSDLDLADARKAIEQAHLEREHMMQALSFLNQPETQQVGFGKDKPARGNIFVNPRRGILLIASNLPPLTPGHMFEMWVIPKAGGGPRPAGLFQSSDSGTAFHMLTGEPWATSGDAIAVTVEPESGSSAPTTTPLFVQAI